MKPKQNDGDDSDSDDYKGFDEDELLDKQSEQEDMVLKENAAKQSGRIIRDEQDEIIKVQWESYKKYYRLAGGFCIVLALNLTIISFIGCQLVANYYTQKWAYADPDS